MYIYSRWTITQAAPQTIAGFVAELTGGQIEPIAGDAGAWIWARTLDFGESVESEWETS